MKMFTRTCLSLLLLMISLPEIQLQDLDPFDMLNFDPSSTTMKNEVKVKEDSENRSGSLDNFDQRGTTTNKREITEDTSNARRTTQDTSKGERTQDTGNERRITQDDRGITQDSINEGETTEDAKKEEVNIPPEYVREGGVKSKPTMDFTKCPIRVSKASIFFRQYVRTLLHHLAGKVVAKEDSEFDMRLVLDSEDVRTLRQYGGSETEVDLQAAHEVLTKMIYMVKVVAPGGVSRHHLWVEEKLGISVEKLMHTAIFLALVLAFVALLVRLRFTFRQLVVYLFVMFFILSVCLTWVSLYKKEVTKQHYAMMKDMPEGCKNRQDRDKGFVSVTLSWLSSQFTFQEDKCIDYYEMMLINPLVKVSPVEALAVTATRFFIAPLRHIAEGISDFTRTLLKDLPVQLWPLVLGSMGVFCFLFLFMGFGYRVRLPFGMLAIEPGRPAVQNAINQQDLKHVEDVQRNEILEMRKKQNEMVKMITVLLDNQEASQDHPAVTVGEEGSGDASSTQASKSHKGSKQHESPLRIKDSQITREVTPKNKSPSEDPSKGSYPEGIGKDNLENVENVKSTSAEPDIGRSEEVAVKKNFDSIENVKKSPKDISKSPKQVPIECTDKVESFPTPVRTSNIPVRRKSTEEPQLTGGKAITEQSVSNIGPAGMNGSH